MILTGDAIETLRTLPAGSARCCVTSPPYYGLRDYGVDGQIGLEETPTAYVERLVQVFREVRRVLADDGTLWLNLGDSYAGSWGAQSREGNETRQIAAHPHRASGTGSASRFGGLRPKNRLMIPARVALALQADGWWLRDEIVWHKPRTTPHPVKDRTVSAHEMVYLLSKRERYFFDWEAIEEPAAYAGTVRSIRSAFRLQHDPSTDAGKYGGRKEVVTRDTRRARSVWSISPSPYRDAHFATMPVHLAEQCVKAGSAVGDTVLDPFGGAGTTGLAAKNLGRGFVLCELNPAYVEIAKRRLGLAQPERCPLL